ncbi:hypothetical protein EMIHUDRAFT_359111, partial [Emiliania huxleyi CCMP1516]|uniref:Uncharacterized protein n=2 Tax=Emiliania huxleyi TaxID=2903 RepID=A0A0D3I9P9_EMIH1
MRGEKRSSEWRSSESITPDRVLVEVSSPAGLPQRPPPGPALHTGCPTRTASTAPRATASAERSKRASSPRCRRALRQRRHRPLKDPRRAQQPPRRAAAPLTGGRPAGSTARPLRPTRRATACRARAPGRTRARRSRPRGAG